jgi:hypothetical protein
MKTDLISQSPENPDGRIAGESFQDEQLRYQGTDMQESAIDAEEPMDPDGELASFSALTLKGEDDRSDEGEEREAGAKETLPTRVLDNSVVNLQEE